MTHGLHWESLNERSWVLIEWYITGRTRCMFNSLAGVARCRAMTRTSSAVGEAVDGSTCTFISILINLFGCVHGHKSMCILSAAMLVMGSEDE